MPVLQKRVWDILDVAPEGDRLSQLESAFMLTLILLNAFAVILGTVESIEVKYGVWLHYFEVFSILIFTLEYVGRLWSCVVVEKYAHPIIGRLRFALTFDSIVDLISVLPFYLSFLVIDLRILRLLRFIRLFRLLKLTRYATALVLLKETFRSRRAELGVTVLLLLVVLTIAATLMYFAEKDAQPDKFSDIPSAMWWAVITLTTIGYGDVFPVTMLGKFIGGLIAVLGIGFVALPTGIISVGFVEELRAYRERLKKAKMGASTPEALQCRCPHCGKEIELHLSSRTS
ncbi:MAG: ion transporter [Chloroherpetonaceae bacterium]|nr:ion transporter [Chloroherpetonaceae bacterium]MCS7211552.1 ion transporter [Chloroherpetonaceae bacterium]MDW8020224.1 ion transporter [Chloroherpetonaceae bacterium]